MLETCPFCGGEAEFERFPECEGVPERWVVRCPTCGAKTMTCSTKYLAMKKWNRRTKDKSTSTRQKVRIRNENTV